MGWTLGPKAKRRAAVLTALACTAVAGSLPLLLHHATGGVEVQAAGTGALDTAVGPVDGGGIDEPADASESSTPESGPAAKGGATRTTVGARSRPDPTATTTTTSGAGTTTTTGVRPGSPSTTSTTRGGSPTTSTTVTTVVGNCVTAPKARTWSRIEEPQALAGDLRGPMVYDTWRREVLFFGGSRDGYPANETWVFDGCTRRWEQRFPKTVPPPKSGPSLAFDEQRGVALMFGGGGGYYSGLPGDGTWAWNGTDWTELHPANSPSIRAGQEMVYDRLRGEIVLFGGFQLNGAGALDDTWTWDGANWHEEGPATRATGNTRLLAYDAATGRTILFGGGDSSPNPPKDTWSWDGTTWTQLQPSGTPADRWFKTMTFLPGEPVLLAFSDASTTLNSSAIWAFDGSRWAPFASLNPAPDVVQPEVVVDPDHHLLILHAGTIGGRPGGTWVIGTL